MIAPKGAAFLHFSPSAKMNIVLPNGLGVNPSLQERQH